jgi:tetratricopeptide (TPR) repeat protein
MLEKIYSQSSKVCRQAAEKGSVATNLLLALGVALCLGGCAVPVAKIAAPLASPARELAEADALVRAGCFDCLRDGFVKYEGVRTTNGMPAEAVERATAGSIQAAGLLAVRQRELGMVDDGYLQIARNLLPEPSSLSRVLDIIEVLPIGTAGGAGRPATGDAQLARVQNFSKNWSAWRQALRDVAGRDALTASVWMSVACGSPDARALGIEELMAPIPGALRETPLLGFRKATCLGIQAEPLQLLLMQDPRFAEITYLLGLSALSGRRVDEASEWFDHAYAWRPEWPTLTSYMGDAAITGEEFERALLSYDRTLSFEPLTADAQLGKIRALSYLGRSDEALVAVDELLTQRWFVGDGRYWRAFNESPLGRNDEAWLDVEQAARLLVNAEVPKLAGIIAYRRRQLDVARAKFDESRLRNPADCETGFYLGIVLGELGEWNRTVDVFVDTARCFELAERELTREIEIVRASDDPAARKQRQIARRERRIASGRRRLATAWFNTAAAYYNLSRFSDARPFAEKVASDDQFGERARELLALLK